MREHLLAFRRRITVEVASGVAVDLQAPTAGEWLEYQRWIAALPDGSLDHLTRIVVMTAVNDEGKPLLTEEDCLSLDHRVLTTLARAAFALTGDDKKVAAAQGES